MNPLLRAYRSFFPTAAQREAWKQELLDVLAAHPGGMTGRQLREWLASDIGTLRATRTWSLLAELQRDGRLWAAWQEDDSGTMRRRYYHGPKPGPLGKQFDVDPVYILPRDA